MDKHKQYAYRFILYWAMIDIRSIRFGPCGIDWLSLLFWLRYIRSNQELGELAEWLHNMAEFSLRDFIGFDEHRFWEEFERFRVAYPNRSYYRSLFDNALIESRTGRWPKIDEL